MIGKILNLKVASKSALLVTLSLFLSACQGAGNFSSNNHARTYSMLSKDDRGNVKYRGHYKVGKPYKIKGKEYYKIQVTFSEDGGGDDFDDVFIYWFNKETFYLEYLAYKYHTNGGGVRFRDVKKENLVNGIRFVDYNNYKPMDKNIDFNTIDKLYEEGKLKKLSEIVLENIKIKF